MKFATVRLTALVLSVILLSLPAAAQTATPRALAERAAGVRTLLAELKSDNSEGNERYLAIRDEYANRIWSEVDAFVSEGVSPRAGTDTIKTDLDTLLNHTRGDLLRNEAFLTVLPAGRYLVVALELQRTAGAFSDNAFSIRAYRDAGVAFSLVAHTEPEQQLNPRATELADFGPTHYLRARVVPSRSFAAEFLLLFWADATARRPSFVAIRLFAFDGSSLRLLWAPGSIESDYIDTIKLTPDGFVVRSVFDPTGGAFGSPTEVKHEQFVLTVDGPQKVNEWNTSLLDEPR